MLRTNRNKNDLWRRALRAMPGGVNSPVRSFGSVGGQPLFFSKGEGSYLFDTNGKRYLDLVNSWGALILGHAHPTVVEAVTKQIEKGLSYGAPSVPELELAEYILDKVLNIELVRMVNSGTEACMSALRLARAYTGKHQFIKFKGCYHGHADPFLVSAGSGPLSLNIPDSPGVSEHEASNTLLAGFNDIESVDRLIQIHKGEIAAIIVEPIPGNMGCIVPEISFLQDLKKRCDEKGIILIFDEVMSGFRASPGGAQLLYDVYADLVTFGKIIGGGLPVGAFGGKREIMEMLAPSGPVYQAGTMSGNPVAMATGLATLKFIEADPHFYNRLNEMTSRLNKETISLFAEFDIPVMVNQVGSMISLHFTSKEVVDYESARTSDREIFANLFHLLLEEGIYLPPSPFESCFISAAMTDSDMDLLY